MHPHTPFVFVFIHQNFSLHFIPFGGMQNFHFPFPEKFFQLMQKGYRIPPADCKSIRGR